MRGSCGRWLIALMGVLAALSWGRPGVATTYTPTAAPTLAPAGCCQCDNSCVITTDPAVCEAACGGAFNFFADGHCDGRFCTFVSPSPGSPTATATATPTPTETPTACPTGTPCGPGMHKICAPGALPDDSCRCSCQPDTPAPTPSSPTPTWTATACPTGTPCGPGYVESCSGEPANSCTCTCLPLGTTATPTPTVTPIPCVGDCDASGDVTIDEILTMVKIALGTGSLSQCEPGDGNGDNRITIDEILTAINNALDNCPGATPVETATPTPGIDCAISACPDLVPVSASPYWPTPTGGCIPPGVLFHEYYLDVCITNQGDVAAGPFHLALTDSYGAPCTIMLEVPGLDARQSTCARANYCTYYNQVYVVADALNEVAESDETNNRLTFYGAVPSLPPLCATPTPSPSHGTPAEITHTPTPTATALLNVDQTVAVCYTVPCSIRLNIAVTNIGEEPLANVVLNDPVTAPHGTVYSVSTSQGTCAITWVWPGPSWVWPGLNTVTCDFGDLGPGASALVRIDVDDVWVSDDPTSLANTVSLSADGTQPVIDTVSYGIPPWPTPLPTSTLTPTGIPSHSPSATPTPPDCATNQCPDLVPVSAMAYWLPPYTGGCIPSGWTLWQYLNVCIANRGDAPAHSVHVVVEASGSATADMREILPNYTTCAWAYLSSYEGWAEITVDPLNQVAEGNESNNQLTFYGTVAPPPPRCATATPTPA